MTKIALALICKGTNGEHELLDRALESAAPHVDGIFITLTGETNKLENAEKVCKKYNAHISYTRALKEIDQPIVNWLKDFLGYDPTIKAGDKIFLFDEARNFNFSQVPGEYDYILWMDADDVLLNGQNLRMVGENALKSNFEAIYFNYIYHADVEEKDGTYTIKNTIIEHLRERLVRNAGLYKWVANIHETLIEQRPTSKTDNYDVSVLHLATQSDRELSLQRNLRSLEYSIYRTEGKDPRPIYYLAKAFFDLNTEDLDKKAVILMTVYLFGEHKSGWPEERSQACEYLSEIYRRRGQLNNSLKACMNALLEQPENPSIYINIAATYMIKGDWERSLFWIRLASSIPDKKTTLVKNPKDIQIRTLQVIYSCALNLAKVDEAWAAAVKLFELMPENPDVVSAVQFMERLKQERDTTKMIVEYANLLKKTGETHKIKPLLKSVPNFVEKNPFIEDLYKQNNPPKYWDKDEIAIYCGPGFTSWSPKQLDNPGGSFVGGSEEAVIHMSRELQKQGWRVTVYGDPGDDEGEYNGVKWLPYYKFNKLDSFNILISWRQLGFFDQELKAKKKLLWNHDIQNPLEYTKERTDKIDKVIFLSEWHRDNVPDLPVEKVLLSSNGI